MTEVTDPNPIGLLSLLFSLKKISLEITRLAQSYLVMFDNNAQLCYDKMFVAIIVIISRSFRAYKIFLWCGPRHWWKLGSTWKKPIPFAMNSTLTLDHIPFTDLVKEHLTHPVDISSSAAQNTLIFMTNKLIERHLYFLTNLPPLLTEC